MTTSTAPILTAPAAAPASELEGPAPGRSRSPVRRGASVARRLASEVGQGTVEYVGLLLLMATLLAAIVAGAKGLGGDKAIGQKVVTQIGNSIDKAGGGER